MTLRLAAVALALPLLAVAAPALADGWVFSAGGPSGPSLAMDAEAEHPIHWQFSCAGGKLTARQAGATELMDLSNGKTVPDTGLAELPAGAAKMALLTERHTEVTATSKPGFEPAQASPDPVRGWDLTITVPMDDPAVKDLARAKKVTLMSTGFTTLVDLGDDGRPAMKAFLNACQAK